MLQEASECSFCSILDYAAPSTLTENLNSERRKKGDSEGKKGWGGEGEGLVDDLALDGSGVGVGRDVEGFDGLLEREPMLQTFENRQGQCCAFSS